MSDYLRKLEGPVRVVASLVLMVPVAVPLYHHWQETQGSEVVPSSLEVSLQDVDCEKTCHERCPKEYGYLTSSQ